MQQGKIVRLNNVFGFIAREGEQKDLFFHLNELQGVQFNELGVGDTLQFEVEEGQKGLNAVRITRIALAGAAPVAAAE
jgi:CspA family cold shock protein